MLYAVFNTLISDQKPVTQAVAVTENDLNYIQKEVLNEGDMFWPTELENQAEIIHPVVGNITTYTDELGEKEPPYFELLRLQEVPEARKLFIQDATNLEEAAAPKTKAWLLYYVEDKLSAIGLRSGKETQILNKIYHGGEISPDIINTVATHFVSPGEYNYKQHRFHSIQFGEIDSNKQYFEDAAELMAQLKK